MSKKLTGKTSDAATAGKANKKAIPSNNDMAASAEQMDKKPKQPLYVRMVQNFLIIWLDKNIDENNDESRETINDLRQMTNDVHTFTDVDNCINFITAMKGQKVFMISSGALGQTTLPLVRDMDQVSAVYIFCSDKARHDQWAQKYSKIKGVFTDMIPLCEALKKATQACDQSTVSMSFISPHSGVSNNSLDQIDKSFIYIQILKEILLNFDIKRMHSNRFIDYCHKRFGSNRSELKNVNKLKVDYIAEEVIKWYTEDCFLYSMLNRAIHHMNIDIIIRMGFFIRDLHDYIAHLYSEELTQPKPLKTFTVYHGQGLSQTDFDQLEKTKGGLLIFNSFLSASKEPKMSRDRARKIATSSNLVGIDFAMKIDPLTPSTPFANIHGDSSFLVKDEILFSMQSVFRITDIERIDNKDRVWKVNLTQVGDNDAQLCALTEQIRRETLPSTQEWDRLGKLLIKHRQFNIAEQLYFELLGETNDESQKAFIYYQLGSIKNDRGDYKEAVKFYKESIEIDEKVGPLTNPRFIAPFSGIAQAYSKMDEYSRALSYYEKAHKIVEESLPKDDPCLATSYNNIGSVYSKMGDYSKALSSYEHAIDVGQRSNHPNLLIFRQNLEFVKKKL
jgi:hypothetical protein